LQRPGDSGGARSQRVTPDVLTGRPPKGVARSGRPGRPSVRPRRGDRLANGARSIASWRTPTRQRCTALLSPLPDQDVGRPATGAWLAVRNSRGRALHGANHLPEPGRHRSPSPSYRRLAEMARSAVPAATAAGGTAGFGRPARRTRFRAENGRLCSFRRYRPWTFFFSLSRPFTLGQPPGVANEIPLVTAGASRLDSRPR